MLPGGRLTAEDAFAYSKFARTVLKTNDIDFRARAHSAEEAEFLASHVVATSLDVTFASLEKASTVVLVGFEPEDEAGAVFLRLRKASRTGVKVVAIASHTDSRPDQDGRRTDPYGCRARRPQHSPSSSSIATP